MLSHLNSSFSFDPTEVLSVTNLRDMPACPKFHHTLPVIFLLNVELAKVLALDDLLSFLFVDLRSCVGKTSHLTTDIWT